MSELQFGLIGLGAVAIVGVVVYNTWQEYRQRKIAEQILSVAHADVLFDAEQVESDRFASELPPAAVEPDDVPTVAVAEPAVERHVGRMLEEERREPVLRVEPEAPEAERREPSVGRSAQAVAEAKSDVEPVHLLSPVIDYVVALEATDAKPAGEILATQQQVLDGIGKALHWIGYNESTREWETIADERGYRRLRVGLQLVDRRGRLSASDLAIFHDAMQDLAEEWRAAADLPPCQPALETAATLDTFCASVDIQIGINVVSGAVVFPGTKLRALAESAGMVIDAEGRFVRCDDDGNVLYVLINQEASAFSVDAMKSMSTHGVTFLLDVPRVAHGERVFSQMVELAKRFADVLRGSLVDDNRRPLSDGALEPIRRQIAQYQSLMLARNVPAGSALAQRLFS